jgi:predicted GNAT family acetyltransferase
LKFVEEPDRFVLLDDEGREAGEITWALAEDVMIVDHTFVDDKYRGKGYAVDLVRHVVDKARRDDEKVLPLCPFARKEFQEKPEYQDVLRK